MAHPSVLFFFYLSHKVCKHLLSKGPKGAQLRNFWVGKISDVRLARILFAVAENVTQCHMTSAAGTFCYIDPEYQQTGMLGVKSDV